MHRRESILVLLYGVFAYPHPLSRTAPAPSGHWYPCTPSNARRGVAYLYKQSKLCLCLVLRRNPRHRLAIGFWPGSREHPQSHTVSLALARATTRATKFAPCLSTLPPRAPLASNPHS